MATDRKTLAKVQSLVRLAQDGDDEENRNAAIQATRLMKEHELVLVPQSEIDRINAMMKDAAKAVEGQKGDKMRDMAIGAVAAAVLMKGGMLKL